ncbi:M48 family metallopeptidase [Arsukibacterium sp.]|uniref:M48 family metallopeptidase n=1 Tax=Arsukibacterium sp. TaxID=1977258 RepID=UPI002FD98A29
MRQQALPFTYQTVFSARRRTVAISVQQAAVTVRAPKGYCQQQLLTLLTDKQHWVMQHLQRQQAQLLPELSKRTELWFAGQQLSLSWQYAPKGGLSLQHQHIQLTVPKTVTAERLDAYLAKLLRQWLESQATDWFAERVQHWQEVMQVKPTQLQLGNWRRKWGYCDSKGRVGFNWRLLQAPAWVADYVVVHELAHLRHLNHSAAFWLWVQQLYPLHKAASDWLTQHQTELYW